MGKLLVKRDYSAQAKAIAANTTTTWTSSDIPSERITRYHIYWQGATLFSHLSRVRVKANGVSIYDLSGTFLRAFIRRFSKTNFNMPPGTIPNTNVMGTASGSTTSQPGTPLRRFTIPFDLLDADSEVERLTQQFPPRSQVTIELQWGGSASSVNAFCGWTETRVPAECYPKLYASQMNIAASTSNGRYNIQDDGEVYAVGVNTVGLERFKVVLGGEQVYHQQGISVGGTATGDGITESEQLEGGWSDIAEALTTTPGAASVNLVTGELLDPTFVRLDAGSAIPGSSYVELQTGAGWAGAANELCIQSRVKLR